MITPTPLTFIWETPPLPVPVLPAPLFHEYLNFDHNPKHSLTALFNYIYATIHSTNNIIYHKENNNTIYCSVSLSNKCYDATSGT